MAETHAQIKIVPLTAVIQTVSLGRAMVYRLAQRGQFPKPIRLSPRRSGWIESEVIAWLEARIAQRDGGVK